MSTPPARLNLWPALTQLPFRQNYQLFPALSQAPGLRQDFPGSVA